MFSSRLFRRRSGAAPFEDQGRIIRGLFSRRALKAVRASPQPALRAFILVAADRFCGVMRCSRPPNVIIKQSTALTTASSKFGLFNSLILSRRTSKA